MEAEKLYYVIGANKLKTTQKALDELPESEWRDVPSKELRGGCIAEQTCIAWVQCTGWQKKRLLVGKRFKRESELIWNTLGARYFYLKLAQCML